MGTLRGVVTSGAGEGAWFMTLPWVRDAVYRLTGFHPYAGTLNLRLADPRALAAWRDVARGPGLRIDPPTGEGCGGRLFRGVVLPDIAAAVIVPDVTRHPDDIIEIVAACHVRSALGVGEGDAVALRLGV